MAAALMFLAHGTVDDLEELPAFLTNIRRGHAPTAELLHEVRRRYEAIGGRSPLNAICGEIACQMQGRLGLPVRSASRLAKPATKDVLRELIQGGATDVAVVALAQHSAGIYEASAREAAKTLAAEGLPEVRIEAAKNWGHEPKLLAAYAAGIVQALKVIPEDRWPHTTLVLSAHSLPVAVVRSGDPYEAEVRTSAEGIVAAVKAQLPKAPKTVVCFQSQGMSSGPGGRPVEWLGPGLEPVLDEAKARGDSHVLVAPVGFLADHVEILYDIDIEATAWAEARGLTLSRTASLNASAPLLDALEAVARRVLQRFSM